MAVNWSISTGDGLALGGGALVDVLAVQHRRFVDTWRGFTSADWEHRSRNEAWTVHETVRHVADGAERVVAAVSGEASLDEGEFDALSTPAEWLAGSTGESPAATIDRFAAASAALGVGVGERLASGDDTHQPTVYGTAHWTVNVVHLLWDSWLHERDVLLPLGRPAPSSEEEERLVGLYGLLMALVPPMKLGLPVSVVVQLRGAGHRTIEAGCGPDAIHCAEVAANPSAITGRLPAVVDALAGRGDAVADALPAAPDELGFLAAFFNR